MDTKEKKPVYHTGKTDYIVNFLRNRTDFALTDSEVWMRHFRNLERDYNEVLQALNELKNRETLAQQEGSSVSALKRQLKEKDERIKQLETVIQGMLEFRPKPLTDDEINMGEATNSHERDDR